MAEGNEVSTQVGNQDANPPVMNPAYESGGKLRFEYFKSTQVVLGDAGTIQTMARIPAGQGHILKYLSFIRFTAFGAARTLDMGYAAHTNRDGTTVNASGDILEDGRDVSAANAKGVALGTGTVAAATMLLAYDSNTPIDITATIAGDTWPAGAILEGYIAYISNK